MQLLSRGGSGTVQASSDETERRTVGRVYPCQLILGKQKSGKHRGGLSRPETFAAKRCLRRKASPLGDVKGAVGVSRLRGRKIPPRFPPKFISYTCTKNMPKIFAEILNFFLTYGR